MERYYSPAPNFNADRNEDGSFCASVQSCENCGTTGSLESILTDDGERLLLCDPCIEAQREVERLVEELAAKPGCAERTLIVDQAETTGQLFNHLRAHDLQCLTCGSTRKTVSDDRLWLGTTTSTCCDGEAA